MSKRSKVNVTRFAEETFHIESSPAFKFIDTRYDVRVIQFNIGPGQSNGLVCSEWADRQMGKRGKRGQGVGQVRLAASLICVELSATQLSLPHFRTAPLLKRQGLACSPAKHGIEQQ
jgi:hypothetical protein